MAKENLYDLALKDITEIVDEVSDSIANEFKKTRPFDKEPVDPNEMLLEYNMRGYQKFKEIADTEGLEAAVKWGEEIEKLKTRRK